MYQVLILKQPEQVDVPSEHTICRVMEEISLSHRPKRKPNGITRADREARKSEDLLKRDFHSKEPLTKCVTDITEIKASNGKRYVSAIFDCFDLSVIGLAMDTNVKAPYAYKRWRMPIRLCNPPQRQGDATPARFIAMQSVNTESGKRSCLDLPSKK